MWDWISKPNAAVLAAAACLCAQPAAAWEPPVCDPQAQAQRRVSAERVLDELHAAAARADGAAYFQLFAEDAVFLGTDVSERWPLAAFRAYAEPHFAAGRGWTYKPRTRTLTLGPGLAGCSYFAWFDEVLDSESYGTSRGTGVLVFRDGAWRVAQYALTFPIPNDLAKEFTARIKAHEAKAAPPRP